MKFFLEALLIILAGLAVQWWLPWWSVTLIGFLVGLGFNYRYTVWSFLAGFLGSGLVWFGVALILSYRNGGILAGQLGELLGGMSPGAMLLFTGLLGGLLGGLGAWSGTLARGLFSGKPAHSSK